MSGSADKTIRFSLQGDAKGFEPIQKAIKSLQGELERLQKLVGVLNVSGGKDSKSNGFLAKVIKEEDAMRKLYKTTTETAQAIDRVFNRTMEQQAKQVENLTQKLEKLNAQSKLQRDFASKHQVSDQYRSRMANTDAEIANTEAQKRDLLANSNSPGALGKGGLKAMIGSVALAAVKIGAELPNAYKRGMDAPFESKAAGGNGFGANLAKQAFGGDFSSFLAMAQSNGGGINDSNISNIHYAGQDAKLFGGVGAVKDIISGGIGTGTLGLTNKLGITGGPGDITSGFATLKGEGLNALASQKQMERLQQMVDADPMNQFAYQDFRANSYSRLNAFRMHGGEGAYNDNMHAGFGAGMNSEAEIAQLQATLSKSMGSTRGNRAFAFAADAPGRLGLERTSAANLMSGLMGGAKGDVGVAEKRLEEIITKATAAGITDSTLREDLAQAVVDAQNDNPRTSGTGYMDALMAALKNTEQDKTAIELAKNAANGLNDYAGNLNGGEGGIARAAMSRAFKQFGVNEGGTYLRDKIAKEKFTDLNNITEYDQKLADTYFGGDTNKVISMKKSAFKDRVEMNAQATNSETLKKILKSPHGLANLGRKNIDGLDPKLILNAMPLAGQMLGMGDAPMEQVQDAFSMLTDTQPSNKAGGKIIDGGKDTTAKAQTDAEARSRDALFIKETVGELSDLIKVAAAFGANYAESAAKLSAPEIRDASKNVELVAQSIKKLDDAATEFLKNHDVLIRDK